MERNPSDVSFTGMPAASYGVAAGERLEQVVLFALDRPLAPGSSADVIAELRYDGGGKLSGLGLVSFMSSDPTVATIDADGTVVAIAEGRARLHARLGDHGDHVPVEVRAP